MNIGILGMPLSGKTTIFNLLTNQHKKTDSFISPKTSNIGVVKVIDDRLDYLGTINPDKKIIYATMEIIDIAGIKAELSEKLKQDTFAQIQNTDALLIVVRVFQDKSIPGETDPISQLESIIDEIILRDLEVIENRINRLDYTKHKLTNQEENEKRILESCVQHLSENDLLVNLTFSEEEMKLLSGFSFFSLKPIIVAVNLDEEQLRKNEFPTQVKLNQFIQERKMVSIPICGKIEMEINELPDEERQIFLEDLGLKESGIRRLTRILYQHLGLISFFTIGKDEVKAWTIKKGTTAVKAAGKVHSDMERGFIRAEIINLSDLKNWGSIAKVKEKGLLKIEGKNYLIEDGDIIKFRFNV